MVAYRKYNEKILSLDAQNCLVIGISYVKKDVGLIHFHRLSKDISVATNDVAQVRKDKKSYRENDRVLNRWREKFI